MSKRRIVFDTSQLLSLYEDRLLFSTFLEILSGDPSAPVQQVLATARYSKNQLSMLLDTKAVETEFDITDAGELVPRALKPLKQPKRPLNVPEGT